MTAVACGMRDTAWRPACRALKRIGGPGLAAIVMRALAVAGFDNPAAPRTARRSAMPHHVCMTAQLKCSMGKAPSKLLVPVPHMVVHRATSRPPTSWTTSRSMNIMPFGMCNSKTNPTVIAATAAAQGVPTPMPCIPVTPAPWATGSPHRDAGQQTGTEQELHADMRVGRHHHHRRRRPEPSTTFPDRRRLDHAGAAGACRWPSVRARGRHARSGA